MTDQKRWKRTIEALLFASGDPLPASEIVTALDGWDTPTVEALIQQLRDEYDASGRGIQLVEVENGYQLTTRPEDAGVIRRLFTKQVSSRLTTAALEALAIVAYHQPVTRADVEDIRGVNSDSVLNSLIERKLVTISGRKDVPGRPLLYSTTDTFLRHFGLKDLTDLPSLEELSELFDTSRDREGDEDDEA